MFPVSPVAPAEGGFSHIANPACGRMHALESNAACVQTAAKGQGSPVLPTSPVCPVAPAERGACQIRERLSRHQLKTSSVRLSI